MRNHLLRFANGSGAAAGLDPVGRGAPEEPSNGEAAAEAARVAAHRGEDPAEALAAEAEARAREDLPPNLPPEDVDAVIAETTAAAMADLWQTDPELAARIGEQAATGGEDGRVSASEAQIAEGIRIAHDRGDVDGLREEVERAVVDGAMDEVHRPHQEPLEQARAVADAAAAAERLFGDDSTTGAELVGQLEEENPEMLHLVLEYGGGRELPGFGETLSDAQQAAITEALSDSVAQGTLTREELGELIHLSTINAPIGSERFMYFAETVGRSNDERLQGMFMEEGLELYERTLNGDNLGSTLDPINLQSRLSAMLLQGSARSDRAGQALAEAFESGAIDAGQFFSAPDTFHPGTDRLVEDFFEGLPELLPSTQRRLFPHLIAGMETTQGGMHDHLVVAGAEIFANDPAAVTGPFLEDGAQLEPLARFFDQAAFDPNSPAASTVQGALDRFAEDIFAQIENAETEQERELATRSMSRVFAAFAGGASLAFQRYEGDVAAREKAIKNVVDAFGVFTSVAGVPTGGALGRRALNEAVKAIADGLIANPEEPDLSLIGGLVDYWTGILGGFERATGTTDVVTDFSAVYSLEMLELWRNLGIHR